MSATARLEVRVRPEVKKRIEHAAELAQVPVSDFVRTAAEERADRVLAEHLTQTLVPVDFFDALLDALDAEPQPNPALAVVTTDVVDSRRGDLITKETSGRSGDV